MADEINYNELAKQTALNVSGISNQLGIVVSEVKRLGIEFREIKADVQSQRIDFEDYKELQRQKERVEADEVQEYADATKGRVGRILKNEGRDDLFGKFLRKCWSDCKSHSHMRGKSGVDTKRMHHAEVINYIGTWEPYGYGTKGYIDYLDSLKGGSPT